MNRINSYHLFHSISELPKVRGHYSMNANLADLNRFKVGGLAQVLFKPQDIDDLLFFLKNCPSSIPVTIVGKGSNLLIRDGGVSGVVVKLGHNFTKISIHGNEIKVESGTLSRDLAIVAYNEGLSGLEFMIGIPGTVGGNLRMNAGCYGQSVRDCLVEAYVVDRSGNYSILTPDEVGLSYRHCNLPSDWIFSGARFKTRKRDKETIMNSMKDIINNRRRTQPIYGKTCGSTFVNPVGFKAWELIDAAGCRGLECNGAQISFQHCNFLVNTGKAKASDIENLGEDVRRRVFQNSGINLRWEIERIGYF